MTRTPRRLFKTGIASALHWTGADGLFARRASVKSTPLVVGYHRVVEDFEVSAANSIAPMLVSVRTFERHLDWIGRRFKFVTLDELATLMESAKRFDKPVAAVTFDDGYGDVYHHAFPVLKRKGIPAAIFVVTDLVGTPRLQIHDELYLLLSGVFSPWRDPGDRLVRLLVELGISSKKFRITANDALRATRALLETLSQVEIRRVIAVLAAEVEVSENAKKELRALSWKMLREMCRAGVTIGSHTRTHALLTNEDRQKVLDEIKGSRRAMEQRLGTTVEHFAYPDGRFNATAVKAVAAAGYRRAYTSCRHRDARHPALTIPRRLLWENSCLDAFGRFSPALLSCQVSGVFDFVAPCRQTHAS